jgi:hypothetical protein
MRGNNRIKELDLHDFQSKMLKIFLAEKFTSLRHVDPLGP